MPGPLKFLKRDPEKGSNRGEGWYYHRGKGIYSKYSGSLDRIRINGPNWDNSKKKSDPYRHTHDYNSFRTYPGYPTNKPKYSHKRKPVTYARFRTTKRNQLRWNKSKKKRSIK